MMPDNVMTPAPKPVPRKPVTDAPRAHPYTGETFEPESHDALLQEYSEVGQRYAPLFSRYGAGNVAERIFKSYKASIAVQVRAEKAAAGEKVTEPLIEAAVDADPRVVAHLHAIEDGRLQYQQVEIELECVRERLRRMDAVTRRGI